MKTIFCALALILISANSMAQQPGDTIIVQSFDWPMTALGNSGNRDMVVPFPDDSTLTYEKIIMKYNMRCRNGDVNTTGGNYVACGEWDYSCNTYIHDSTRIDSTQFTHPDFLISGFSGASYSYTTSPTFDYFQHTQQLVTINSTLTETVGALGAGSTSLSDVIQVQNESGKSQFLLSATELQSAGLVAGDLTGIRLNVLGGTSDAQFLRIRAKSTALTSLDAEDVDLTGFSQVYFQNYTATVGLEQFQFAVPFNWDGTSNVILELNFTAGATQAVINIEGETAPLNSALKSTITDRYIDLGGANQYIDVPDATMDFTNGLTYSSWVNYDGISNWARIIDFGNGPNADNIIFANPGTTSDLTLNVRNSVGSGSITATNVLIPGEWMHVAATIDAAGNGTIYVNGAIVQSGAVVVPDAILRTNNYIGRSNWTNDSYLNSKMDDIAMWNVELSQAEIQNWMFKDIDASHPQFSNLLFAYNFNDGNLLQATDLSGMTADADFMNYIPSLLFDGRDIFKNVIISTERPNIEMLQGTYTQTITDIIVLDSLQLAPNIVTEHQIVSNAGLVLDDDISLVSTNSYWEAVAQNIYDDQTGTLISTLPVTTDGTITPVDLDYLRRWPMKFEIVSFVTPYGNGLDLGIDGKTWNFDLTDFTPILKGNKRMTMERGGQWNESFDIQFWFIVGTPPRDVVDIEQIWRNDSKGYTSILSDAAFEPRMKTFNANATSFKVRSAITGHGQEGEFISREHYVNVNGGPIEFSWQVWKECAENAIFPQGGTWVYDRAGWCPGRPTDLQEFDITNFVTPGQTHELDYGIATASGTSNYIVNNQLVSYGGANFTTDAAIIDIMNPSDYVEYERTNSICANPIIILRNTGSALLTEAVIEYWVNNDPAPQTFTWTGSLPFMAETQVTLPTPSALWDALSTTNTFHAQITSVNAGTDEYTPNNHFETGFSIPEVTPAHFYVEFKTNNAAFESSWELLGDNGTVLGSRAGMSNNTTYKDTFNLGYGCYQLKVLDSGDDGIAWWANNDGTGYVRLREVGGGVVKTFEPDFGESIIHNFTIDYPLAYEELNDIYTVEVYPNPTSDQFFVEAGSISEADIEIYNGMGQLMNLPMVSAIDKLTFDSSGLPTGIYLVKINYRGELQTKKIIVE